MSNLQIIKVFISMKLQCNKNIWGSCIVKFTKLIHIILIKLIDYCIHWCRFLLNWVLNTANWISLWQTRTSSLRIMDISWYYFEAFYVKIEILFSEVKFNVRIQYDIFFFITFCYYMIFLWYDVTSLLNLK